MWYLKSKSRKLLTNNFCLQHREEFLSTSVWAADVDGWVVGDVVGEVAGDVDADDNADDEAEDWLEVAEVAWEDVGEVTGEVADEGARIYRCSGQYLKNKGILFFFLMRMMWG